MDQIHDLEIRAAYLWALEGNVKNTLAHIEYAKEYLENIVNRIYLDKEAQKEEANLDKPMRYWQNQETGRTMGMDENPGDGWNEISKVTHRQAVGG